MAYDPGSRTPLDVLTGQNTGRATPDTIPSLPDAGDQATIAAAQQNYTAQRLAWLKSMVSPGGPVPPTSLSGITFMHDIDVLEHPEKYGGTGGGPYQNALASKGGNGSPTMPDALAVQSQSDRARLLGEAAAGYAPLIGMLMSAAQGNGPSAALNTYRAAADDAARRTYGDAASARGTGGQRAAIFQAALGQAAQQRQQAAGQSAIIAAQEQNQARAGLGSALAGLTNVYGTDLYGGTQAQQGANQNAQITADKINADIANNNATNQTNAIKGYIDTGAKIAGGV